MTPEEFDQWRVAGEVQSLTVLMVQGGQCGRANMRISVRIEQGSFLESPLPPPLSTSKSSSPGLGFKGLGCRVNQ